MYQYMKYPSDNIRNMVTAITFFIFLSPAFHSHWSAKYCLIFDGLNPINIPDSVKICITDWPSFVRYLIEALISSIFKTHIPTIFTNSGQRLILLILNYMELKSFLFIPLEKYWKEAVQLVHHHPKYYAKCYRSIEHYILHIKQPSCVYVYLSLSLSYNVYMGVFN